MKIVIGCDDGKTYNSKEYTRAELQTVIDDADGYIGTGDWAKHKFESVDEVLEFLLDNAKYDTNMHYQTFTLDCEDGINRTFNACHIVWYGVER